MNKVRTLAALVLLSVAATAFANGVGIISKIEFLHFEMSMTNPTLYIVSTDEEVSKLSQKASLQNEPLKVKVRGLPFTMRLRPASGGWLYGHMDFVPISVYVLNKDRAERMIP